MKTDLAMRLALLVTIGLIPIAVVIVTLLQQGDGLMAAVFMIVCMVIVIVLFMKMMQTDPEDQNNRHTGQGYSTSVAAAESPPAYDVIIKSTPPNINYPGNGSFAHPAPASMYYCYCGSGDATRAAVTSCTLCSQQSQGPYIIHLNQAMDGDAAAPSSKSSNSQQHGPHKIHLSQDSYHPDGCQSQIDPFLPSYSEAVMVDTYGRDENIHL